MVKDLMLSPTKIRNKARMSASTFIQNPISSTVLKVLARQLGKKNRIRGI